MKVDIPVGDIIISLLAINFLIGLVFLFINNQLLHVVGLIMIFGGFGISYIILNIYDKRDDSNEKN